MVTILHGDNVVNSRKILLEKIEESRKKGAKEIIRLNGASLDLTELKQAVESQSLFGLDKLVVIEGVLSRPKSKIKQDLIDYLKKVDDGANLILWEQKSLTKTQLKLFLKSTVIEFKTSTVIFKFLEAIRPNNSVLLVKLYQECLRNDSVETLFYMISRQIRMLLMSMDNEIKMPSWQVSKLKNQLENLGEEKVLSLHEKLIMTDEKIKTGKSNLGLKGELDLMLASI
jgi:DNA polymerase III delta subunit